MDRTVIATDAAPAAIGPYSQAIKVSGASATVYVSGQIPLDPKTGEVVGDGDVSAQTTRVLDNLGAVLEAAGMGWGDIVKTTIYLADMGDFATVNELYAARFGEAPPARATVQVAGLPKGVSVEIDAIAAA
jgi:2-iminobutanoate/2-iminopropanoate deaminase